MSNNINEGNGEGNNYFAKLLSYCKCCRCALATPAKVPDRNVEWNARMRHKPKVEGFRCHCQKPSSAGLPAMESDGWCVFFTDMNGEQPLRHLVSSAVREKNV